MTRPYVKRFTSPTEFDPIAHIEASEKELLIALNALQRTLPASSSSEVLLVRESFQRAYSHLVTATAQLQEPILTSGIRSTFRKLHTIQRLLNDTTLPASDRLGLIAQEVGRKLRRGRLPKNAELPEKSLEAEKLHLTGGQ